jgi:hypothetical protein
VRRLDVTGFREGDQVTFAADVVVVVGAAADAAGQVQARLAGGTLATGFPLGSTIVGPDGYRSRLRRGVPPTPGTAGLPGAVLTIEPADASPPAVGDSLTVLYPFPATVLTVNTDGSGQVELTVSPMRPPGPPPEGTIVSTLGGQVRAPLLAGGLPGPSAITRMTVRYFTGGQTIVLGSGRAGRPPLTAVAERVDTVSDHVHLDPYVFAYSAGHRIRIRAG